MGVDYPVTHVQKGLVRSKHGQRIGPNQSYRNEYGKRSEHGFG
jgi:hypothetical protein